MAKRAEQLKEELVEKVVALVRERVAGERATETERFVRAFYSTVPAIDLADETADNLYGAALSIWNFARKRPGGLGYGGTCQARGRCRSGHPPDPAGLAGCQGLSDSLPVTGKISR